MNQRETLGKPYPREKLRKKGNREMRRESVNARKVNRPRQFISSQRIKEKELSKEESHTLWWLNAGSAKREGRESRESFREDEQC